MNVFYLDTNPKIAAQYHCDKHVVKMLLETAQLLSTAHRVLDTNCNDNLYKAAYVNHPSAVWTRESALNYMWLYWLFYNLNDEYNLRYSKEHKSFNKLNSILCEIPKNIPYENSSPPPLCMPDQYKSNDAVASYRAYYNGEKASFAKWKLGNIPHWFNGENTCQQKQD